MTRTTRLPTFREDPDWDTLRDLWLEWLQTYGVHPSTVPVGARVTVDDEAGTVTVQVLALRHGRPYMDVETGEPAVEDLVVVQDGPVAPFPVPAEPVMPRVAKAILWQNGMVMAFDPGGGQIPELQGRHGDVAEKVAAVSGESTVFEFGSWHEGSTEPVDRAAWLRGLPS